jgi:hypothetical protein
MLKDKYKFKNRELCADILNTTVLYMAVPLRQQAETGTIKSSVEKNKRAMLTEKKKWWENRADELGE